MTKTTITIILISVIKSNSQVLDLSNFNQTEVKKIDSIINFNQQKNSYKYLVLLPNLSYNPIDNSFGLGINLSNFSNYFQTKKRNEIESEKLKFQLLENQNKKIENLQNEFELIQNSFEILILEIQNTAITKEIFNLKKSQYENNKITLEMWLNVQNDYQKYNLLLFAKRKNLITKMKSFELKIKNSCFLQELNKLKSSEIDLKL